MITEFNQYNNKYGKYLKTSIEEIYNAFKVMDPGTGHIIYKKFIEDLLNGRQVFFSCDGVKIVGKPYNDICTEHGLRQTIQEVYVFPTDGTVKVRLSGKSGFHYINREKKLIVYGEFSDKQNKQLEYLKQISDANKFGI